MKLRPRDNKPKRKQDMNPNEILEKKQKNDSQDIPLDTQNSSQSENSTAESILTDAFTDINNRSGEHSLLIETLTSPHIHESLLALQELSEILSIATEDQFLRKNTGLDPTAITKILLNILQSKTASDLLPDQMLMACRCLYNLIEAFPPCIITVVELKGVECLVDKLLEIEYIDLAEQVIKIQERISKEYPLALLKSNALFAHLQYLDFFSIHVQRHALKVVANTLLGLDTAFGMVLDVIDIIMKLLQSSDLKIQELAIQSIWKIVDWVPVYRNIHSSKNNNIELADRLSELITKEHLTLIVAALKDSYDMNQLQLFTQLLKITSRLMKSIKLKSICFEDFSMMKILSGFISSENENIQVLDLIVDLLPNLPCEGIFKLTKQQASESEVEVDEKLLNEFLTDIFPVLTRLFKLNYNMQTRRKILLSVLKYIHHSNQISLELLQECNVGEMVFDLVHLHNSFESTHDKILVLGGLTLAKLLVDKCQGFVHVLSREGLPLEISEIILKDIPDDIGEDINRLFEPGEPRPTTLFNRNRRATFIGFTNERFTEDQLLEKIFEISKDLDKTYQSLMELDVDDRNIEALKVQQNLICSLATQLIEAHGIDKICKSWQKIGEIIKTVTAFELIASNLVDFTIDFITNSPAHNLFFKVSEFKYTLDVNTRIEIYKQNMDTLTLVEKLLEYIGRLEQYKLKVSPTSNYFQQYSQITRQLRILVNGNGFESIVVSAPAIGSFKVLEVFVKHRSLMEDEEEILMENSADSKTVNLITSPVRGSESSLFPIESTGLSRGSLKEGTSKESLDAKTESFSKELLNSKSEPLSNAEGSLSNETMREQIDKYLLQKANEATDPIFNPRKDADSPSKGNQFGSPSKSNHRPTKGGLFDDGVCFYVNGNAVDMQETLFSVFYNSIGQPDDISKMWSTTHTVTCKPSTKTKAVAESESKAVIERCSCELCNTVFQNSFFDKSDTHPKEFRNPLYLLSLLNALTENNFTSLKLNQKVLKQINEPLMSISNIYPVWAQSILFEHKHLLPFETRQTFFKTSALGHYRNTQNYLQTLKTQQGLERGLKADKLKVRINRNNAFETMCEVLGLCEGKCVLEFEFIDEAGSGLGPTLEFFSLVSESIRNPEGLRPNLNTNYEKVWRGENLNHPEGLFPRPCQNYSSNLFEVVGEFVGRSILDDRQLDLSFNLVFIKQVFHQGNYDRMYWLKMVDQVLYNSLLAIKEGDVESMNLDYVLPGYPEYELIKNGENIPITTENVDMYIKDVLDATLGKGISVQICQFRKGFSKIIDPQIFRAFSPAEIDTIISGQVDSEWNFQGIFHLIELRDSFKPDHGYSTFSKTFIQLCEVVSEFDQLQRRDFLSFCTGSPKLPRGGFKALDPKLTVVRKVAGDECLPSVMTCAHYLKLPEYSDVKFLRNGLLRAISEGKNSFHLS